MEEWIKKLKYTHTHTHTEEYYSVITKIMKSWPFTTTWMKLEGIMLSEVSQTDKEKYHMNSLICIT